jgi:hypothetical protein
MRNIELLIDRIRKELQERPLEGLRLCEEASANENEQGRSLEKIFAPVIKIARFARAITAETLKETGPILFSSPRQDERRLLVAACVARFVELGAEGADLTLTSIGLAFGVLVLEGTPQQQLCGRLAIELGQRSEAELRPLLNTVATPLIAALQIVLRVGAAPTRDSAVEGLGALLRSFHDTAAELFPAEARPTEDPVDEDVEEEEEKQSHINRLFFDRLDRRRLMVFAVARDAGERAEFFDELSEPVAAKIQTICDEAQDDDHRRRSLKDALYSRADLLRTLPGLLRQAAPEEKDGLRRKAIQLLRDASSFTEIDEDDDAVHTAFVHYQESVFRTIDVMIKRDATGKDFDKVLALALKATPGTLVGHSSVCNARVRATFALIRTAARLITKDPKSAETIGELGPLFSTLADPSPWSNLGIAEGCYYVVPYLARISDYDKLSGAALGALFTRIRRPPGSDDLAETHHQLVATACFRRLILILVQRTDEHSATDPESLEVKRDVSKLLTEPTIEDVLDAFQNTRTWSALASKPAHPLTTGIVIAGTAFETELLVRGASLFVGFDGRPSVERLLLTRILAAQLRAASQDWREIERYDQLRQFWANMPTVSLTEKDRIDNARKLVSELPSRAAAAADPDLQEFLEYCGRKSAEEGAAHVQALPGHVLAMVSDKLSDRIADAIAREIDLNLRYGETQAEFDLGELLYQVVLRGPNKSIFSRLLPRVDRKHRKIVALFKKHVKRVHTGSTMSSDEMLSHIDELTREIDQTESSKTLKKLKLLLRLYRRLFANEMGVWESLEKGELATLFLECDDIMTMTEGGHSKNAPRARLSDTLGAAAEQLKTEVTRYRELPIGEFEARSAALAQARMHTANLEASLKTHRNLQPPEREMLVRLMQQLDDLFRRTIQWYCEQPRNRKNTRKENRHPAMFYRLFAEPIKKKSLARIFAEARHVRRDQVEAVLEGHDLEAGIRAEICGLFDESGDLLPNRSEQREPFKRFFVEAALENHKDLDAGARKEILGIFNAVGEAPPEFPQQRVRFEELFVDWMESELDVDMLQRQFRRRWGWPFGWIYATITNLAGISAMILIPCLIAIALHRAGHHDEEGVGFFFLAIPVLFAALVSPVKKFPPYYFKSLLPRLARLIVVPLALTVELDHSYSFPLHASTWALALLILLSFAMTWFYVDREIVSASAKRLSELKRIAKVVALALSQAFAIAVLLATIFGSHAHEILPVAHEKTDISTGSPWDVDTMPETGHKHPYFARVLPRDVKFDLAKFVGRIHPLSTGIGSQLKFTFYPTIILTWTALGLFIGVFLEGFFEGKRLRGGEGEDGAETASE